MMNYFSKCSEVHLKINFKKVPIPLIPGFALSSCKNIFAPPPPPRLPHYSCFRNFNWNQEQNQITCFQKLLILTKYMFLAGL